MPVFFEIVGPRTIWGDYGRYLLGGEAANKPDAPRFPVQLMRVGPFVPRLSFPWGYCVFHADFADELSRDGFKGIGWGNVVYEKVTNVPFHTWDWSAEVPPVYPAGGEVENYVRRRKHNDAIAKAMPRLKALDVAQFEHDPSSVYWRHGERDPGIDAFQVNGGWTTYVSERLMLWLVDRVPEYLMISDPMVVFEE